MTSDSNPFAERRRRLGEAIGDALAVIPGAHVAVRNADTTFEFRQDSDFFYLTGFDEPDAVALLNPAHATDRFVLFVRPRDRETEQWDGRRAGVEGALAGYGADAAYPLDELDARLREYALGRPALVYRLGNPHHDARITRILAELRGARALGVSTPVRIEDPDPMLHELRLRRSPEELASQRRACLISRDAHVEAMRHAAPGQYELELQAVLEFVFRRAGSPRAAYGPIVASGPNATILHYRHNRRRIEDGDLVLIDAACEWDYQAADITRTIPANGRFTPSQRRIYEVVLRSQLAAIAVARPGNRFEAVQEAARRTLVEGLIDLGLLPRSVDESLAMGHYREFCGHGIGHWLGMDVHDVGGYRVHRESRVLEPGMVLTVEPGLYFTPERESATFCLREFSAEANLERRYRLGIAAARKLEDEERASADTIVHAVPDEYRGIGIRIEDDVLVTTGEPEVLTAGTPKTVDAVEGVCAEASAYSFSRFGLRQ